MMECSKIASMGLCSDTNSGTIYKLIHCFQYKYSPSK